MTDFRHVMSLVQTMSEIYSQFYWNYSYWVDIKDVVYKIFITVHELLLADSIWGLRVEYCFSFDSSEVGIKVVNGFHLTTDVQLWEHSGCSVCAL